MPDHSLPIDDLLPAIRDHLSQQPNLLLSAAPGAGKTTRVPLALLQEPWLAGKKILLLEPRRLAARNAARFMAEQLGEAVGEQVGYRIRLEQKISAATRIEVLTEGILTRLLQDDPELTGVGLVIFDEFHERHLHSDLALALVHQCQQLLRPDLRLLVMSATLDEHALQQPLQAPLLHSEGRSHAVVTHYRPRADANTRLPQHIAAVVSEALQQAGDMLVFLPGTADIRHTRELLQQRLPESIQLLPLHGQLSDKEQKTALQPAADGSRRIILATNIAESSLTIDGVRIVIDSGLERRLSFSPQTGVSELKTRPVSRASATQRAGRAGRQASGVCYRLWPESEHERRDAHIRAEILDADLAPLQLELLQWGAASGELLWLDPPPAASLSQASQTLHALGIQQDNRLTEHGRLCATLGTEPRLAHLLVCAARLGMARSACELIALLQEWPHRLRHSDDLPRLLQQARRQQSLWQQRVRPLADQLYRRLTQQLSVASETDADPALLVALAWPERIARRRHAGQNRFLLANGSGAELTETSDLFNCEWLALADISGGQPNRIRLAAELSPAALDCLQDTAPPAVQPSYRQWLAAIRSVAGRTTDPPRPPCAVVHATAGTLGR
ncbi:MAG: ATP-dependent helicase HrpB [Pseudomonadota bacterium]|nr:ATP-dependent helicase HrpB [Pseudomonadota bacterium]